MGKESQNFTEKELEIVYFFIKRRKLLKKIFIGLLILLNLVIYSFSTYHFIQYLKQSKEYEKMIEEIAYPFTHYPLIRESNSPFFPQILLVKAIPVEPLKYNLICLVKNENRSWFASSFNYHFNFSNFKTETFKSFLLPDEEKVLVIFNEKINQFPGDLSCQIENISWKRIKPNNYQLLDIPKNFLIQEIKHNPATKENERDITTFKITNATVYNFWEVNLLIVAYLKDEIIGVERFPIEKFMSNETREIKIIWSNRVPFFSEIKVYPELNVFDESIFLPYKIKPKE
jgi:hypothetical protein